MQDQAAHPGGIYQQDARSTAPCPGCGGSDVIRGVEFNQGVQVGPFGAVYRAAGIFTGTESLHADICRSCGAVARFYVKRTDRNWVQR